MHHKGCRLPRDLLCNKASRAVGPIGQDAKGLPGLQISTGSRRADLTWSFNLTVSR